MRWFSHRLNHKFTIATIVGFTVSALVFYALFLKFYQHKLENERAQAAREVNMLLQTSLENAMLKRDLNGLRFIVNRLGNQPNIQSVMIANPAGQVRFSNDPERMGENLENLINHISTSKTLFIQNEQGVDVLRSILPVLNKTQCQTCHGLMEENPVNGILVVDYEATNIKQNAQYTTLLLMGAGAIVVIINLLGGWWFIRRFIVKPIEVLSDASQSFANGDLKIRVNLPGQDELSKLGSSFNLMASKLQHNIRELEESKDFLQAMVDAVPDGLRIIDNDYKILLVNQTYLEQTACTGKNLIGEKCYLSAHNREIPCPAELMTCPLQEINKKPEPLKLIHHHSRCDGKVLDVEIFAAPMKVNRKGKQTTLLVESIRDLSQQVDFTHQQNLSELGRLAAGVAHEIYNPLSTMKLAISSLVGIFEKEPMNNDFTDYLNVVEQEMDHCIQITDRLLRLSAAPPSHPELVDCLQAVIDIQSLVKWDAENASIKVTVTFPEQPLRVLANQGEMRMLILNLVQNAFHAMPDGGLLHITGLQRDNHIEMRFEDNGIGISIKNLNRIFMPFFSRRAVSNKGTGLGLPISRSIVQSFNGSLQVESEEGKGSCFIVKIPNVSNEV